MKNILQTIKLILFIGVVFGTIQLQAQEKHFIYIQNENKQPFYVKLNKEVFSSTPGGYLIIPQLVVGKYDLATGFAKNEIPEQKFMVDLNKDAGFSLKQSGDKEWELFDLQSFKSIVANNKDTITTNNSVQSVVSNKETPIAGPSKKDSSKVNDSETSITTGNTAIVNPLSSNEVKKDIVTADVPVKENSINEIKKDSVTADLPLKENSLNEIKKDSVTTMIPQKEITHVAGEMIGNTHRTARSFIVKTFASMGNRGFDLIYIDKSGFKRDTIALFIPHNEKITKVQPIALAPVSNVKPEINSGVKCSVQATDEDFYKTRMHIASATTENSMILAAKAAFRTKCFSTKQVKYLDVLFLSEESRLRFLEIAKPYVYDPRNFSSLQSQFTEPLMIQRFRALLKKK